MKISLFIFLILFVPLLHGAINLCPGVVIHGKDPELNETEMRLVCGDEKMEAYKYIPPSEASVFFTGFLQSRGYLNPSFENRENVLHVKVGRLSRVKKINIYTGKRNLNKVVKREIKRLYQNRVMNTSLLNSIEADVLSIARQRGYPCARARSEVNSLNDTLTILLERLTFHEFGPFKKEDISGLHENALDRFYPFSIDEAFNEELLKLTEKRIVRSEVMPGTYFLESCSASGEEFSFEQRFLDGPPRTVRFGVGASTELGPMLRVRWNHNRYKSMASLLSATAQASFKSQSLNLTADSFFWNHRPRRSLLSQAEVRRERQFDYEQTVYSLRSQMKWTLDKAGHFQQYIVGPNFETGLYQTAGNTNTKTFSNMVLSGDFSWMSHKYEFFDIHPQEGDEFRLKTDYRHPSLGFSDALLKLDSTTALMGRVTNWGRGTLVAAGRLNAGTSVVSDAVSFRGLPPEVKFFGGGSDDVRGFALRTLPKNDGLGALSKLSLKFELRRTYVWKESLEVFAFYDNARFGEQSWKLEERLWHSPGLGLRWLSPIGMVQTFYARGFATKPYEDFGDLFYAGLGGVF